MTQISCYIWAVTLAYSLHLHQQGITRIIQTEPGKCLHCWGVQAEMSLLFVHATRHHSVMLNIYFSGNAHLRQTMYSIFFFFFNFGKDWWTTVGESGLLTKKLFLIVAFKWPTSWQSAERMSELWEDRPAYIFSFTARFAEQLHFHIFFPVKTSCRLVNAFAIICGMDLWCWGGMWDLIV